MRLHIALFVLAAAACGPTVTSWKLNASVDSEQVNAFQEWPSLGDRLNAGVRDTNPSLAELKKWEEKAGWLTYRPDRSCFGILTHQLVAMQSGLGEDMQYDVVDFEHATYKLVTASGQTLESEKPIIESTPLQLRYETFNQEANRYIPAMEQWVRNVVGVCFVTPKPLADEQWVKWTYGTNKFRNEFVFTLSRGQQARIESVREYSTGDE